MWSRQIVSVSVVDKSSACINVLLAECVLQYPARGGDGSSGSFGQR